MTAGKFKLLGIIPFQGTKIAKAEPPVPKNVALARKHPCYLIKYVLQAKG
jgi:hypothetical protein